MCIYVYIYIYIYIYTDIHTNASLGPPTGSGRLGCPRLRPLCFIVCIISYGIIDFISYGNYIISLDQDMASFMLFTIIEYSMVSFMLFTIIEYGRFP